MSHRPRATEQTTAAPGSVPSGFTEHRFPGMGGVVRVVVAGDDPTWLLEYVEQRIGDLETAWSRFRETSSRLVAAHPASLVVPLDTFRLVACAVEAWRRTGGAFDPTVHLEWVDQGTAPVDCREQRRSSPGCAGVAVDADRSLVRLPCGVTVDPHTLRRGLAADIVTEELMARGARSVLVDVAGVVRIRGGCPTVDGWVVDLPHRVPPAGIAVTVPPDAAVASGTLQPRRRTRRHRGPRPTPFATVAVTATTAWRAETLVTAVIARGGVTGLDLGTDTVTIWRPHAAASHRWSSQADL